LFVLWRISQQARRASLTAAAKTGKGKIADGSQKRALGRSSRVLLERLAFQTVVGGVPDRVPIDEETPQNPINPYGESKLMFEKVLRWFNRIHEIKYVALRYFNAAGASERFGEHHRIETHLIPRILAVALGHSPNAEIYGTDYPTPDGTCIRDYIHIYDLAQAHILALSAAESGYFNLGTGGGVSVYEVIEACRRVTGHKIPIVEKPRRPGDPPRLVAASEKAKKQLGWTPKFQDIHEIVKSAWAWHEKHPNGYSD
jgi:UDP-glucose 4-epimerase